MSVSIEVVDNYVYRTDKRLGEGAFGKVFLGKEISTNEPVAVKKISKERYHKDIIDTLYKREIEILKSIKNDHVIKLINNMETSNHKILILELCDMNLRQLLQQVGRIEEKYALRLFREILEGLQSLHMQNYCHRDIKPDNILLKGGIIKIIDVNISKRFTDRKFRTTSRIGTPKYMAPEVQYRFYQPYLADVYSLGVVFYEILYGIQPQNWRKNLLFNDTIIVSKQIRSLIENMIKQRPQDRFDWEKISIILMPEEQSTSLIQSSLQNYYIDKWQCSVFFLKSVIKNIIHSEQWLTASDFCVLLITKAIKSKIEKIILYLQKQGETVLKKAYLNEIGRSSSELIKKRNVYLARSQKRLKNQDVFQKDLLDLEEYLKENCEDTTNLYQTFMEEFTKNERTFHFQYFFQYYLKQFYLNIAELKQNQNVNQLTLRTLQVQILVALDYFNDYENAQDLLQESGLISSIYQSEIIPKIKAKEQHQELSIIIENYWNEQESLQISQKHFQTVDEAESYCLVLENLLNDQYSNEQFYQ